MATVASPTTPTTAAVPISRLQPGARLFTAADMDVMPTQLPTGPVSYELHHGRLIAMSPPGARHGNLQVRIGGELYVQGQKKGHGRAYTDVAVVLAHNPDLVFGPDAAFLTTLSLPERLSPEGYLENIPELIVEVRSKNDTKSEVAAKVADYLKAGAKVVWTVDEDTQSVTEHRPSAAAKDYAATDTLQCEDVIPGFRLPLAELFRE